MIKPKTFDRSIFATFSYISSIYARQLAAVTPSDFNVIVPEKYDDIDYSLKYDIVHIHFRTATATRAYEVADDFRRRNILVVLSGCHPSALPDEAKNHADSVIIGIAELLWPLVLKDLKNGELKPVYTPGKYTFEKQYEIANIIAPSTVNIVGIVEATKGCPYKCDFCQDSNMIQGSEFRTRDIEDVIKEIEGMPQKFIFFCDVSMTIDVSYTKELFKRMKILKKKFVCEGNADVLNIDEELIRLSSKAGCIEWTVGFESFTQQVLDDINKKTNFIDDYQNIVRNIHKYKMAILGNFIFGFDHDTKDVFDLTLKNIRKISLDSARFAILTPYPGTPLFEKYDRSGRILTKDWSKYNRKNVVFQPENMSVEDLQTGYEKVMLCYNSVSNIMVRNIKSLKLSYNSFLATLGRNLESYMNKPKK